MTNAKRDGNFVPTLIGVSSADGTTPVTVYVDPTTHRLKVDLSGSGSGSVTSVSVVSANGFAGTVATATSTPAITLTTTITGLLQGNGTAISAQATSGTGNVVRVTSATLITPALGTPSALVLTNATGLPTTGMVDNAVTLAKMAGGTDGNLITYDASGDPAYVATGDVDQVLTSNGAGAAPTFQDNAGGGGDVVGPSGATNNAVARYDTTTGKLLQDSVVLIADTTGVISGTEGLTLSGTTSGTTSLIATAVSGTRIITLPAATDTLVGKATTDILTNKTVTAGTFATSMTGSYLTDSEMLITDGSKNIVSAPVATYPSLTELAYLKGVTSAVQTQLTAKAPIASPTFTGVVTVSSTLELGHASDTTLSRVSAGIIAVEGVNVVTTSSTDTLTNKRLQPRTNTTTTAPTLAPNLSVASIEYRETQTEALTISAPTGTPVKGDAIAMYIDSVGAETLTMNATYKAFGAAFPATTTAGKTLMITTQYNGTDWATLCAELI